MMHGLRLKLSVFTVIFAIIGGYIIINSFASAPTGCTKTANPTTTPSALQTILTAVAPGDVLCLHQGNYGSQGSRFNLTTSGTSASRITIRNYPGEAKPVLLGFYVLTGQYTTLSGLRLMQPTGNVTSSNSGTTTVGEDVKLWLSGATSAEVTDSEISGSLWNAGIYISGSDNISITDNWIHDNGDFADARCANSCHGIYWGSGSGAIKSNLLEHNQAAGITLFDNGVVRQPHDVIISENTAVQNLAYGIQVTTGSYNVKVVDNISAYNGIGLYGWNLQDNSNTSQNNLLFSNSGGNEVNYLGAGTLGFSGNIIADPQFVSPLSKATGGNYRLKSTSPAIDKGLTTYANPDDLEGKTRPVGILPDIGAYEYGSSSPPPTCTSSKPSDINCDNNVNIADLSILLSNYGKTTSQLSTSTPSYPRADINNSGKVDIADLSVLLSGYGR